MDAVLWALVLLRTLEWAAPLLCARAGLLWPVSASLMESYRANERSFIGHREWNSANPAADRQPSWYDTFRDAGVGPGGGTELALAPTIKR